MIYVQIHGRLGNQMFQYAFARLIQLKNNEPITMNFSKVASKGNDEVGWRDDLKNFNVCEYITDSSNQNYLVSQTNLKQKKLLIPYFLKQKIMGLKGTEALQRIREENQPYLNSQGIYWIRNGYFNPKSPITDNIIIYGHFENENLYRGMEDILRNEFTPKLPKLKENEEVYSQIEFSNSVCVSIRRGDFMNAQNSHTYHLCNDEYFYKAVNKMKSLLDNPRFFIFSDDPTWVRENMDFPENSVYETEGNPVWEKLRLMYSCKNFIISNSTFSWWAQFLSKNEDKIVISPSRWKNGSSYKGLISDDFVEIEV